MQFDDSAKTSSPTLEDNLKKALTEVLILHLLSEQDRYIGELASLIHERSGGALTIVFPYAAIYRLESAGYLAECGKHNAPDGRRRQYYRITAEGKAYLTQLMAVYTRFTQGVADVFSQGGSEK